MELIVFFSINQQYTRHHHEVLLWMNESNNLNLNKCSYPLVQRNV